MKNVDLDEPTSFLDHVYLGCSQRERKPNRYWWMYKIFESRISAGATEKLPGRVKPHAKAVARSYDTEGHARKMRWAILPAGKRKSGGTLPSFQVLAWMIINSNKRNLNKLDYYHKCAHKLSSHACTWHELGDQTLCGLSTNLQEQSRNGLRHAKDDWQDWFHASHKWMPTILSCG